MTYRLIAIDIDGTLVNSAGEVTKPTRQAVQRVVDAGLTVLIATGRRYLTARSVAVQLDTEVLIAAHNGALLKQMDGTVLQSLELPRQMAQRAVTALFALGHDPLVFQGTQDAAHIWIDRDLEMRAEGWMRGYLEKNATHLRVAESLAEDLCGDVLEVVAVIPRDVLPATLDYLENALGDDVRLITQITQSDYRAFLEIAHPQVSKSMPLTFLAEKMQIQPSQMIAFGDNYNDLDMLEYAGLGVIMSNTHDDLKQRGYRIAPSNDDDGVAVVLNELFPE